MPNVYVKTLGCKVNSYDSQSLLARFTELGYTVVENPKDATVSILNTCSVTENADKEARHLLRRFKRENPKTLVVATGCYAQTDSAKLVAMDEVDLVVPNEVKNDLAHFVHNSMQSQTLPANKLPDQVQTVSANKQGHFKTSLTLLDADPRQTRAFLKIQDGCNGFCTYCLIPYARGASRSVSSDKILAEVRRLIESGIQEIVIAGIHLGDYGEDFTEGSLRSLPALLAHLFTWPDMVRIRISSLEPNEMTEELLAVLATRPELVCPHFHLPLQSGHDRILKAMRRQYTTEEYKAAVLRARRLFPEANIGADIIPGFPGESDEEFESTLNFIKELGLNYLHVFPYSKRPNTAAARMPGHLPPEVVKERAKRLREYSEIAKLDYTRRYLGRTLAVIWEDDVDAQGRQIGRSENYLEIAAGPQTAAGKGLLQQIRIKGFIEGHRLLGVPYA